MPKLSHSNLPRSRGEDKGEGAPLPERTRVEPSPFAEDADGSHTDRDLGKAPRRPSGASSIIVDDALDASEAPPAPRKPTSVRRASTSAARKSGNEWDDLPPPSAEDANATRISPFPERRPARSGSDAPAEEAAYSVEVVSGPDKGIRLPIRGGRMIVGRGDGCDLKLVDTSVSRRHLELSVADDGLVVRDLGSGNGTRVNGNREVEIATGHGDEVALGDTVLKIIDVNHVEEAPPEPEPEPEPEPAPRPPPGRRNSLRPQPRVEVGDDAEGLSDDLALGVSRNTGVLEPIPERHRVPDQRPDLLQRFTALPKGMRYSLIGAGVVLVLAIFFKVLTPSGPAPKPAEDPKVAANREADYEEARKDAKKLFAERKYDKALERANEALAVHKTSELERLINTIEHNVSAAKVLKEAKGAAVRGDYDKAIEKAKTVDVDTDVGDEAKELMKKWEEAKGAAVVEKVRAAAAEGDFATARSLIAQCPLAEQENLRREMADAEVQYKKDSVNRRNAAAAAAQRAQNAKQAKERAMIDEAISPVVRKMESGDFDGAVRQCDRVGETNNNAAVQAKLKVLKKNIPGFGMAYNDGMSKFHGNSFEQAAPALLRALALFENMDISSKIEQSLKDKTAQALAFKGRAAATRQEYGTAARAFKDALRINPDSKEANQGLAAIRRNASEVYEEGYTLKDRDPDEARKRFRDVIDMVPAGDELAKKAQKRINELDGH